MPWSMHLRGNSFARHSEPIWTVELETSSIAGVSLRQRHQVFAHPVFHLLVKTADRVLLEMR